MKFLGVGRMDVKRCERVKVYIGVGVSFLYISEGGVWVFKELIG